MEKGEDGVEERESLSREASFRESVVMGLRLVKGVDKKRLYDRYQLKLNEQYGAVLTRLIENNLLEEDEKYLRLTDWGRRFANQVMAELV